MNKRRLLKLADLLEADAKNKSGVKFDLATYGKPASDTDWVGGYEKKTTVPVDCSTAACAVGLACISGAFKRSGLTYKFVRHVALPEGKLQLVPAFKHKKNLPAVTDFFEIDTIAFKYLFDADSYSQEKGAKVERTVARRIRKFVATGKVL